MWKIHWIAPLFTRSATFKSGNYQGLHFTPQMSKVVERLVKSMLELHLERINAFGDNQFAYRTGRACRDALAVLMIMDQCIIVPPENSRLLFRCFWCLRQSGPGFIL